MKTLISTLILVPAFAFAAGSGAPVTPPAQDAPAFGLSGNVVGHKAHSDNETALETRRLLDEQAHSGGAANSEISAPVYVQTQQRLSKSFDEAIPDFGDDQTHGSSQ